MEGVERGFGGECRSAELCPERADAASFLFPFAKDRSLEGRPMPPCPSKCRRLSCSRRRALSNCRRLASCGCRLPAIAPLRVTAAGFFSPL